MFVKYLITMLDLIAAEMMMMAIGNDDDSVR